MQTCLLTTCALALKLMRMFMLIRVLILMGEGGSVPVATPIHSTYIELQLSHATPSYPA